MNMLRTSKWSFSVFDTLYIFVNLYILSTLTQAFYPFSLNRVWTIGIVGCICFILFFPCKKKDFWLFLSIFFVFIFTSCLSEDITQNTNDIIYWATTLLWFRMMSRKENRELLYCSSIRYEKVSLFILIISYLSVLISLFLNSGYSNQWGAVYYVGFAGDQHAEASSLCAVTALFLLYSLRRRFSWLCMFVYALSIYAVMETGARTFIIPILIIAFYYVRHNIQKVTVRWFVYLIAFCGFSYIVLNSSMVEKFSFVLSGKNMGISKFDGFTSGRSVFWIEDIKAFINGTPFQILGGHGFDYVYKLNLEKVKSAIWAHDDFIHLLLGGGIFSFTVYIYTTAQYLQRIGLKKDMLDKFLFFVYFLFPATVNGFFMYQHLTISLMLFCIVKKKRKKKKL